MSNSYQTILVERRERVAIVTINRPEKRNALNEERDQTSRKTQDAEVVGHVRSGPNGEIAKKHLERTIGRLVLVALLYTRLPDARRKTFGAGYLDRNIRIEAALLGSLPDVGFCLRQIARQRLLRCRIDSLLR